MLIRVFASLNTCDNNPKKSSTTKINKHTPSGYSFFTHCSFDTTKNKLDTINKRRKNILREQKVFYTCKKGFSTDDDNEK